MAPTLTLTLMNPNPNQNALKLNSGIEGDARIRFEDFDDTILEWRRLAGAKKPRQHMILSDPRPDPNPDPNPDPSPDMWKQTTPKATGASHA